MSKTWLTTKEASDLSGYHPDTIRELIREGKITGRKFGIVWQVNKASLLAYIRKVGKLGGKRGPKPRLDRV